MDSDTNCAVPVRETLPLLEVGSSHGQVRVTLSKQMVTEDSIRFTVYSEGNLPLKDILFPRFATKTIDDVHGWIRPSRRNLQGTPDIDMFVDFRARVENCELIMRGQLRRDGVPNAKVYLHDAFGSPAALLDYRRRSGFLGPYYRLWGTHRRHRLASFEKRVRLLPDGRFCQADEFPKVVTEA